VENNFPFVCAAVTLLGGPTGLMPARAAIQAHSTRLGIAPAPGRSRMLHAT
jgi:hypothetical protein